MGDELVKVVPTYELLEVVEEVEALLIWNSAEGVIRIHTLKRGDELGVFVVGTEMCD